jgi:ribosomal protein L20A (L18A)
MKIYEVKGTFKDRVGTTRFTKMVKAEDEKTCKEKTYSLIGSKQRIPRRNIELEEVKDTKE